MIRDYYCKLCEREVYDYQEHRETDSRHKRKEQRTDVINNDKTYSNSRATILFNIACNYVKDDTFTKLTPNNVMNIYQELFKKTYQQYYEMKEMIMEDYKCNYLPIDEHPIFAYLDYMKSFIE
jgi:hypothetical protein